MTEKDKGILRKGSSDSTDVEAVNVAFSFPRLTSRHQLQPDVPCLVVFIYLKLLPPCLLVVTRLALVAHFHHAFWHLPIPGWGAAHDAVEPGQDLISRKGTNTGAPARDQGASHAASGHEDPFV